MTLASCPFCGTAPRPGDRVCRACGGALTGSASTTVAPPGLTLPAGSTLQGGQYVLDRVLGQGGFGITYDAHDQRLGLRLAIKELFVHGSVRQGRDVLPPGSMAPGEFEATKRGFLEEAKVLARFNDPGIVRVLNYFEENRTAYLVMEFLEGETLGTAIERRGPVPPLIAAQVADSTAHTLEVVHRAGLLHRDIKPDNIFLHHSGRIVLIDFGSVREFAPGRTVSHTRLVSPGYAPLEQYSGAAKFGPYTDVYALGATLYHALTGQMPPPATDLAMGTPLPPLPADTPANLREAVTRAMAPRIEQRPQDAQTLRKLLRGEGVPSAPAPVTPAPTPAPAASRPPPPPAAPARAEVQPQPIPVQPTPVQSTPVVLPPPAQTPEAASPGPLPPPTLPQSGSPTPAGAGDTAPPVPSRKAGGMSVGQKMVIAAGALGGLLLGVLWLGSSAAPELTGSSALNLALGAGGGLLGGAVFGWLLWLTMPVSLPLLSAGLTYLVSQNLGYRPPTMISLSIMAMVFSLLFMRLIRRL